MNKKKIMVKFAKDYFNSIGYPISRFAKFEMSKEKDVLWIRENIKIGRTRTRAVVEEKETFDIYDFRGEPRLLIEQHKNLLPF